MALRPIQLFMRIAHPTKSICYLNYAAKMGVRLMTLHSDHELYEIQKVIIFIHSD